MKQHPLTARDRELIAHAAPLVVEREVSGGIVSEVASALRTQDGLVFDGVSLHLSCGIGFCAEHSAVAAMVTHSAETLIETIVAVDKNESGKTGIMWPCGRCRELLALLNKENLTETWVIISPEAKVHLGELLPGVE